VQNAPLDRERLASFQEAMKSRDYTRAETLLLQEIERNPKSPQLLTLEGGIFFLDGKYLNSAIAMKKAEALAPLDDRSRFTLAMAYITLNHRDWARPELEKLTQSDPRNPLYPYWLSRLDYDAMSFMAAIAHAQKAIELDASFMRAYDNLALSYEALGEQEEAIHAYQQAIRLNRLSKPSSPWPPLNLATFLVKLGRFQEAEPYLKESLQYDTKLPQAHYQLGLLLERQKKAPEGVEELNRAASLDPSYAEPHYVLARIYRRKGDTTKAQAELTAFQKRKKESPEERPH
jgi:tetratricopeptide (TPR) repeat protein